MTDPSESHHSHPEAAPAGPSQELPAPNAGQFQRGNTASLKHGRYRSLDRPEALTAIAGKREEMVRHLGGDPSVLQADLVTDYARVDVLIESVARNIEVGGIFTPKGRTRAAVSLLLSLLDRRQRLATTLGIARHVKRIDLAQAFAQQERDR
jgi:hypothetical protein